MPVKKKGRRGGRKKRDDQDERIRKLKELRARLIKEHQEVCEEEARVAAEEAEIKRILEIEKRRFLENIRK